MTKQTPKLMSRKLFMWMTVLSLTLAAGVSAQKIMNMEGNINVTNGNLTVSSGNVSAPAGTVSASTVSAADGTAQASLADNGVGLKVTTGGVDVASGDVVVQSGKVQVSNGTTPDDASVSLADSGVGVNVQKGDVNLQAGSVNIEGGNLAIGLNGYQTADSLWVGGGTSMGGSLYLSGPGIDEEATEQVQLDNQYDNRFSITNGAANGPYDVFFSTISDYPHNANFVCYSTDETANFGIVLDGPIGFLEQPSTFGIHPVPGFYAKRDSNDDLRIHVSDNNHNDTVLSSHKDPESVDAFAQTSFDDLSVTLPFSFSHSNAIIGKGEVVDMAKLVAWAEKKMQEELGETAGKLRFDYNLPKEECMSVAEYERQSEEHYQKYRPFIEQWKEVELGPNGEIPGEAFEEVDETAPQKVRRTIRHKKIDAEQQRLVEVEEETEVVTQVPTGNKVKKLKDNYKMWNDKLWYLPDAETTTSRSKAQKYAPLPDWIVQRAALRSQE